MQSSLVFWLGFSVFEALCAASLTLSSSSKLSVCEGEINSNFNYNLFPERREGGRGLGRALVMLIPCLFFKTGSVALVFACSQGSL